MKMPKIKVNYDRENRVTIATTYYKDKKYKGLAFCSPEDCFDEEIGRSFAMARVKIKLMAKAKREAKKEVERLEKELCKAEDKYLNICVKHECEQNYLEDLLYDNQGVCPDCGIFISFCNCDEFHEEDYNLGDDEIEDESEEDELSCCKNCGNCIFKD